MPRVRKRRKPEDNERNEKIERILNSRYAKAFEKLNPFEQQLALQALHEISVKGSSDTLEAMWKVDYVQRPVSISQFLDDPYYLGGPLTKELYPVWRKELRKVLRPGTDVHEWIFGGAIGTGKTTCASVAFTYLLYCISCLRDPHAYYGLMKGSTIVFGIYSVTKTQAQDSAYSKIQTFVDTSPYFKENFPRFKHIKSKIVFKKGAIQVIAGSRELHAIGLDVFAFLLDEANFLKAPGPRKTVDDSLSVAYKIYNAARTRMKCVAEDTLITTPRGSIPIQNLVGVDNLKVTSGYGKTLEDLTCEGAYFSGVKECFELTLDNGRSVIATEDHRFLVSCNGVKGVCWKRLKELTDVDNVVTEDLDIFTSKVRSIKPVGKRRTYDIVDVPDTSLFYANGIAVHNSRFMRKGGTVPGMVFLISSKKTHASFLENHIKDVREDISEGKVHLSEHSLWSVHPKKHYTLERFKVEIGDQIYPSRILSDDVQPRPGAQVIEVPREYFDDFDRDIDQALRDIAGIATYGICPLIHNKKVVKECVREDLVHPFVRESIVLDERVDITLDEYFIPERLFLVRRSQYIPRHDFASPRFVHIDVGLTGDCAGLSMVHAGKFKEVRRMRGDGTFFMDRCPVIVVDFMLQIIPPKGSEIDLSKIRAFIISLRDMGMPIIKITADGYQSRDLAQIMRKLDFESKLYSIDRTDEPYLYLRQAFVERRIESYFYEPFFNEFIALERDIERRKVDHPKVSPITGLPGSKDVADSLCGAVANCMIDPRSAYVNTGQEVKETDRVTGGGYVVQEVQSNAGNVDWTSIEKQARS